VQSLDEHNRARGKDQGADQGGRTMSGGAGDVSLGRVARFLIHHRHAAHECGVVFASFRGFESPLRHHATLASCETGGHAIWWCVEAADEADALRLVPFFVAVRATATRVDEVRIP
jgi:hypothetical protein